MGFVACYNLIRMSTLVYFQNDCEKVKQLLSNFGKRKPTNICKQISMWRSKQQFVKNTNPISPVVHLRVSPPCGERNTIKFQR